MKIYLIAALFLAALVVAHAEDAELPEQDAELPVQNEQQDQPELEVNDSTEKDDEDQPEETEDSPGGTEDDEEDSPGGTEDDEEDSGDDDVEDEDEEEDPEKRRRRNTLSNISCRRLKQRGYCRHSFIRKLCAAACVPICRNKLSNVSCRRLRNGGKCRLAMVRRYCRRACQKCAKINPCRRYAILNQLNRRKSRPRGKVLKCDKKGFIRGWYRFTGLAGTKMPTRAPPKNRCGAHAPGWMKGSYPTRIGRSFTRKACFHWGKKKCLWSTLIKVRRCRVRRRYFYIFYLVPTPYCHLRYCGNN